MPPDPMTVDVVAIAASDLDALVAAARDAERLLRFCAGELVKHNHFTDAGRVERFCGKLALTIAGVAPGEGA